MNPANRPVIFLDVDGVLNPNLDENPDWDFDALVSSEGFPLLLAPAMAAALWAISTDIRWATTWAHTEDKANPDIGAFFGWPTLPTPMIGYPRRLGGGSMWAKVQVVKDELANPGPPVVWIDDNLGELMCLPQARSEAFDPHGRLILCEPDSADGLTRKDLDHIRVRLAIRGNEAEVIEASVCKTVPSR